MSSSSEQIMSSSSEQIVFSSSGEYVNSKKMTFEMLTELNELDKQEADIFYEEHRKAINDYFNFISLSEENTCTYDSIKMVNLYIKFVVKYEKNNYVNVMEIIKYFNKKDILDTIINSGNTLQNKYYVGIIFLRSEYLLSSNMYLSDVFENFTNEIFNDSDFTENDANKICEMFIINENNKSLNNMLEYCKTREDINIEFERIVNLLCFYDVNCENIEILEKHGMMKYLQSMNTNQFSNILNKIRANEKHNFLRRIFSFNKNGNYLNQISDCISDNLLDISIYIDGQYY